VKSQWLANPRTTSSKKKLIEQHGIPLDDDGIEQNLGEQWGNQGDEEQHQCQEKPKRQDFPVGPYKDKRPAKVIRSGKRAFQKLHQSAQHASCSLRLKYSRCEIHCRRR